MNHSDDLSELAAALAAAQGELATVGKDASNPHFNSKFASLAAVVQAAHPITSKHGLAVTQSLGTAETSDGLIDTLTTLLTHKSGQWTSDTMRLHLTKADPQGHGSATTYARRYAHMAILGLAPEDDDGNAASSSHPAAQRPQQTTRRAPPARMPEMSPIAQMDPKRQLLAACEGDKDMAARIWEEMNPDGKTLGEMEVKLLLSRAKHEVGAQA